eukprot:CAMPEP_0184863796 /NCGR_PEP_ID=MMETSP0580-20130426/12473_1 /TAXON_ID=1118495 /ORGANISM="Dactyliosolen fragilissimus" /LENGTH=603 /DNA_ID=CAMNT_0027362323 /DNA_START=9 /DNA_END=1817 /DNA_ORIENTATION=+
MTRIDLAFISCCFKSCLGSTDNTGEESFYELLGVEEDATLDEIKKAYKRQSLQMHPDKLAQRGVPVTDSEQLKFTRMKEAYEVLSDPDKRETYDTIGERGMKWLEEPFSMDPEELTRNFASSSVVDRSKIFGIFVAIAIAIFFLPILVCLQSDGKFGVESSWMAILTPLWIWNAILLIYYVRMVMIGASKQPENVTDDEWIDPLPFSVRLHSLVRFSLTLILEVLVALRLDNSISLKWVYIFFPYYIIELSIFMKNRPLAQTRIVTIEDLEKALGKKFQDLTDEEKYVINIRYSVVPSKTSPEFEAIHKIKATARQELVKVAFRSIFLIFLLIQLESDVNWNWWFVFSPFWLLSFFVCCGNLHHFSEAQATLHEKDPNFYQQSSVDSDLENCVDQNDANVDYGVLPSSAKSKQTNDIKNESKDNCEREEVKMEMIQAFHKLIASCCSQGLLLLIMCLLVIRIQGGFFSSIWIISPFIILASTFLCFLGCMIFCVSTDDGQEMDACQNDYASQGVGSLYVPPVDNSEIIVPDKPISNIETVDIEKDGNNLNITKSVEKSKNDDQNFKSQIQESLISNDQLFTEGSTTCLNDINDMEKPTESEVE